MRAKLTSLLMILCLLMVFAAVAQAAPAGKVTNLEGRADLTVPDKPARALFIGDTVNVGDILRTKSASKLEVAWIDGSIARLSENSRLKVTEFSLGAKKRTTILSLFRGKVQNIVTGTTKLFGAKDGSQYEVHTPTSVCGVRGTIFFIYHENGVSGALFTQGQGFMYSKGQPGVVKPVAPGILMIVTSANKPPEAKPAKPGDATRLFNATNPSEKKKDDKKSEDKKEGGTGGGASGAGGTTAGSGDTTSGTTGTGGTTGETMLGGNPPNPTEGPALMGGVDSRLVSTNAPGPIVEPTPDVPVTPAVDAFPSVSMETGTVSPTQNNTATFTLSSDATPVTYEYNINNSSWQAITGNTLTLTAPNLPEGDNNIIFRAKDSKGNLTPSESYAQKQWIVYYTNPAVSLGTKPDVETTSPNSPFSVQANRPAGHVNYSYALNGGDWINVGPLFAVTNGLKKDENNISVKATDIAGNSSIIDYSWSIIGLDLLQQVTLGGLSGTLTTTPITESTGTIELTASGTASASLTGVSGSLSDGTAFNGYLAGIPGSWRGLFTALYKKDSTIGILNSTDLNDAAYSGGALNAAGTLLQTEAGTTSDTATQFFSNLPLLVLQNISIGQAFSDPVIRGPYQELGITTDGIMGYNTSTGGILGILGIWGAKTLGGAYVNATGATSENVHLFHYSYDPGFVDPTDHFAFGNVTVTDDLAGHTKVSGVESLTYLDRQYLGTLSLDYRGVYYNGQLQEDQSYRYQYDSVGTGVYNLSPLSWSGDWGQNQNMAWHIISPSSLYKNTYYPEDGYSSMELVAHDMGLAGGLAPFWTGPSRLTALGYLTEEVWNEEAQEYITKSVSGETVAGPLLWNSGIGAQALTGATVGEVFTPDAEFTGVTAGIWKDGLMNGSAYAIYKTAAGQAGWLTGAIGGTYDSDLGIWKAEGDLNPTQRIAQLPAGVTADDLEVFHDIAIGILGGSFTGNQGIINSYNDIMQTTFYGKRISVYDEEYGENVDKILPLRWGIYDLRMAGRNSFSGKPSGATSWTSKIGGYGPTQMNAPFFYLADITTGTWKADGTIDGQLSGTYMTPLYLGVLSGPFYGLYTEGEVPGSGGWIGQSTGTYNVTQKLAHSATWGENLYVWYSGEGGLFTDAGGWLDHTGYVMGLLGGTTAPWSGSSDFKAMGLFQLPVESGLERGSYLWSGAIQGSVPQELSETPSAGGIYTGYSSAFWRANDYAGAIRTLYLTPPDATTGKSTAGFLTGDNITGTIYNLVQDTYEDVEYVKTYTVGLWEATGTNNLTASAPLASELDPAAVTLAGGSMDAKLSGTFGGVGTLTNYTYSGDFMFFVNNSKPLPFGVYDLKLGGDTGGIFSGKPSGAESWNAKLGGGLNIGGGPALAVYGGYNYEFGYWLADVGGQWNAAGEITGDVTNGKYLTSTQMGTLSGPFYGLYTEQGTDETGSYGTWVGQSIGNYQGDPLSYSAQVLSGNWGYYKTTQGQEGFVNDESPIPIMGLTGGLSPLFGETNADVIGLGTYVRGQNSPLFNMLLTNAGGSPETNHFHVYYGGSLVAAHENYPEWFEGKMMGFYGRNWDGTKYNEIGLITSGPLIDEYGQDTGYSVYGDLYPGIGMWELPADEDQGTLTHLAKPGTVSSFSVAESGWSPAAKVEGDLQGTMQRQTANIDGIDAWGIWMSAMGGSYSDTLPERWASRTGWKETNLSGKTSYSIASVDGYYYTDGALWGGVIGRSLNPDNMAVFTGDMVGITSNGNWQAMGIGSYEVTKALAFSSVFSGSTFNTAKGTLNINSYAMPGFNSNIFQGVDYETAYFRADNDTSGALAKYGWQWEHVRIRSNRQRMDLIYYPNDSLQSFRLVNGVPVEGQGSTSASSSAWGFWPDLHQSPPASPIVKNSNFIIVNDEFPFTGPLVVNPANMEFAKIFSQQVENWYTTVRLIPDTANPLAPTFEGIMGGYAKDGDAGRTLWTSTVDNPMGISFMGEHGSFEGPATMAAGFGSSYNGTVTTPDGGAYFGFFTNHVSADRSTRGMFYGFYISPEGEAGFLKSTNITGMSHAGLNMWEADGDIYSEALGTIGMPASDLMANVQLGAMSGNIQYGGAGGNFVSGGYLKHWAMGNGYTASIKGHSSNGIFINGSSAGKYSNPDGSSTWQADFAGYGNFGDPGQPGSFSDYGIWHTKAGDANASWANNQIYSPVSGEFLSYTKKGNLSGTFLGNYSGTTSGIWGGTTSGVYQKTTNVAFSSGMAGKVYANNLTKWISGSNNDIHYWINGDPANFPNESLYTQKMSCVDGACTATQYADYGYVDEDNPTVYTKTTWQYNATGGSITGQTLLESASISYENYLAEVNTMRAGAQEDSGWSLNDNNFQGVFAGFNNVSDNNNLWTNMANRQPTSIELAGLYQNGASGETPGVMTTGLASFNPFNAMDPLVNSTSPIGGAYYAYMGAAFGKHQIASDLFDGLISGLYMNPEGKVGILYGSIGGYNQPDTGYFHGSGAINGGYQLGEGFNGLSAQNFVYNVIQSSQQWNYGTNDVTVIGDNVKLTTSNRSNAWVNQNYLTDKGFWGVVQNATGGTKDSGLAPSAWAWAAHQMNTSTPRSDYTGIEITKTENGISTGNYVGAAAIYSGTGPVSEPSFTVVSAGNIKGLFDPAATTWQAVSQGNFMETKNFLAKAAAMSGDAAAQEAFMNATKIPAVLVGQATLIQNTSNANLSNVTMSNVGFYGYSTGAAPKIWATNDVSGGYAGNPLGQSVGLSGNGLNANFTMNYWNGSTWGANVAGSGEHLSGGTYTGPVQFTGGAAGTIQPGTSPAGSFTGTGAGIAK